MHRLIISLAIAVFLAPAVAAQTIDEVLSGMVEAYGGEEALRKADRMVQEWELVTVAGNSRGTDRRSVRLPDRLKVELTYPHKTEVRLLNGEDGVVYFSGSGTRAAAIPQRDAMRLQLMRLYSPLALRDRVDVTEMRRLDRHWVLTLREFGLRIDYLVDVANYRIQEVAGHLSVGGGQLTFVTEYSEFGFVDGVLVHHRENKFAGSTNTAVLQLKNIRFDVEFDDSEFDATIVTGGKDDAIARR